MLDPIEVALTVPAAQARAFDLFISKIHAWWPMDPFSMRQGLVQIDPKLGGQVVEIAPDGTRFVWGHITAWTRPNSVAIAWYVGRSVETATEITVTFTPLSPSETQVHLAQAGWEALGDAAAEMRGRNDAGWRVILGDHFAAYVAAQTTDEETR